LSGLETVFPAGENGICTVEIRRQLKKGFLSIVPYWVCHRRMSHETEGTMVQLKSEIFARRSPGVLIAALHLILLMLVMSVSGCGRRPYVAKPDEQIFGTWTSKTASYHKAVIHPDGTWEMFIYETDREPVYKGQYQLVAKWKDSQGNIWYKQLLQCTFGTGKGEKTQELDRIDSTGNVWEYDFNAYFDKVDPSNFPTTIDPKNYNYGIYQRSDD
jgi:hypothetical protein